MRPVCLKVKGFTSFKDPVEVKFEGLDRFAICGPTGAGKSSLLDALTFGLFADAPRRGTGTIANLISLGRKSFSIALDFAVGDRLFRVTRVRRRSGPGSDQLEKLAGDKAELLAAGERAVTEKVEALLGLNYGHFIQAVFLPQGKFAEFLKAKPAERRRLLNELLRLLVYERMQERAGQARDDHGNRLANVERRLAEDFQGITEKALADLEERFDEQARIVAKADSALPGLRDRLEQVRQARIWTDEWEAKRAELVAHEAERPQIDLSRLELERAQRAAGVMPLLRQADDARREYDRREAERLEALQARDLHRTAHATATGALRASIEAGNLVPSLRACLAVLNQAKGQVSLRNQLTRQVEETQNRLDAIRADQRGAAIAIQNLEGEITRSENALHQVNEKLVGIGYDEDHLVRLQTVYPDAIRLRTDRARLVLLLERAEADEHAANESTDFAVVAEESAEKAATAQKAARLEVDAAERALRSAQDTHAAAHLRGNLLPGEACPVCFQQVASLPTVGPAPELRQLEEALQAARHSVSRADRAAAQAREHFVVAQANAQARQSRLGASRSELDTATQEVSDRERELTLAIGDLLGESVQAGVEEQALVALARVKALELRHNQATTKAEQLRRGLERHGRDREGWLGTQARLEREASLAQESLQRDLRALEEVRLEIIQAAGSADPQGEATRVEQEIERLEATLVSARDAELQANQLSRDAQRALEFCEREASAAATQAVATHTGSRWSCLIWLTSCAGR